MAVLHQSWPSAQTNEPLWWWAEKLQSLLLWSGLRHIYPFVPQETRDHWYSKSGAWTSNCSGKMELHGKVTKVALEQVAASSWQSRVLEPSWSSLRKGCRFLASVHCLFIQEAMMIFSFSHGNLLLKNLGGLLSTSQSLSEVMKNIVFLSE